MLQPFPGSMAADHPSDDELVADATLRRIAKSNPKEPPSL
jgi:hypothetical protein